MRGLGASRRLGSPKGRGLESEDYKAGVVVFQNTGVTVLSRVDGWLAVYGCMSDKRSTGGVSEA